MAGRAFRFIQASDLHLEQPVGGLAEVPDHLRETLIDAPFKAAEALFDQALTEQVDFVVLAGDVLHPHAAGPRGLVFLQQQLARLAQRNIAVYWCGGQVDPPEQLPPGFQLPATVHLFSADHVEEITHVRDGQPVAVIMGTSFAGRRGVRTGDFQSDPGGLFSLAIAYGQADPQSLARRNVHYWALGGEHQRRTATASPMSCYAGTPQGRSPSEIGPHGCMLIHVDEDYAIRTQPLTIDAVRWGKLRLELKPDVSPEELTKVLTDGLSSIADQAQGRPALVQLTLAGGGATAGQLRRGPLAGDLLAWMRQDFGRRLPAVWVASLEVEPPAVLPAAWYEEDTILGDYLNLVRGYQQDPQEKLDLAPLLAEKLRAGALAAVTTLAEGAPRERILRQAAMLGVDLLRGVADGDPVRGPGSAALPRLDQPAEAVVPPPHLSIGRRPLSQGNDEPPF